jgi:hypothetical protein
MNRKLPAMVNREELIAYLLHQMPEPDRLDFAARWFAEPEIEEQLYIAEAELFDSYVRGELARGERGQVERYLLNTDAQRRKLEFAAALRGVLPAVPVPSRRAIPWLTLATAAILVVLVAVAIGIEVQNQRLRNEVASVRQSARPLSGGVYTASLVAGGLRGGASERSIVLPGNARMLRLDLDLSEAERAPSYSATLTVSGRTVWREEPLTPQSQAQVLFVSVWIPSDVLAAGHYTVLLEANGAPAASYTFAISK